MEPSHPNKPSTESSRALPLNCLMEITTIQNLIPGKILSCVKGVLIPEEIRESIGANEKLGPKFTEGDVGNK